MQDYSFSRSFVTSRVKEGAAICANSSEVFLKGIQGKVWFQNTFFFCRRIKAKIVEFMLMSTFLVMEMACWQLIEGLKNTDE